jgi:hypothetical protein
MTLKFPKILIPSLLGISAYFIINKLFPEKVEGFGKDHIEGLRGGDRTKLLKKITEKILKDRALKVAILTVFASAGIQYFQSEIEALLVEDIFNTLCVTDVDGKLKIVCDIVEEHDLNSHAKSIRSLLISNGLSSEQKISLLKIKLDFIINGECMGKRRFLAMAVVAAILTFTVSGIGGLALILEALLRLFQEGKISKALYKQILKALARRSGVEALPIEHLLDN